MVSHYPPWPGLIVRFQCSSSAATFHNEKSYILKFHDLPRKLLLECIVLILNSLGFRRNNCGNLLVKSSRERQITPSHVWQNLVTRSSRTTLMFQANQMCCNSKKRMVKASLWRKLRAM